ncbi:hypothetical protein SAMN05216571_101357 [Onishia taeanensis]|uniref:Uncharacterized protein n=1 Tax=Onishia taeanensis TaxID=284577 RepID=A0A1G7NEF6_9GAMM|nr:hypothetical protein [Halomonas taeanensis]SDF71699.1 hypothetical protein SAMN05216571_101357 [Halomonas taeanensis]
MNFNSPPEIYEPPAKRRYWVVKADSGKYYEAFVSNSLIAIGHLDEFFGGSSFSSPFVRSPSLLRMLMTKSLADGRSYFNSNNYGQVNSFVNEMAVGDWVLTKGQRHVRVGVITSPSRIDDQIVRYKADKEDLFEREAGLSFKLRRDVLWGPEILLSNLPADIYYSLRAPMTVYTVDQYVESICFTLYPCFKVGETLHLSININKKEEISNYYLSKVFEYLNELDFLSQVDIHGDDLESAHHSFVEKGLFALSTQASFHSPGEIWVKLVLAGKKSKMLQAVTIYSMLFGNAHMGVDGILDLESRQELWSVLIERINMNHVEKASNELQLKMPEYDTKGIESVSVARQGND